MKVLLVNNHHFALGGAEKYYLSLGNLLQMHGHKVAYFSTHDARNLPSIWSKYFINKVNVAGRNLKNLQRILSGIIYSKESRKNIAKLLDEFRPDIVHLNNIYFRISPSIILEIRKRGIPVVETVHDYYLISPSANLYHGDGVCEVTKGGEYYKAVIHKCCKDSYIVSAFVALSFYLHNTILGTYKKYIDAFIAPSLFMKNKLVEYGVNETKISYLPNFVERQPVRKEIKTTLDKGYVLYFGGLLIHKGVTELLYAAQKLPNIPFKIAGAGPEDGNLKKLSKKLKLRNVKFLGRLEGKKLQSVILHSTFCVTPSLWYENQPFSILEAYGLGKPVVASDIGGIPEIVIHGKTGLLSKPKDIVDFEKKILSLWNNPIKAESMGNYAKSFVERGFSSKNYYNKLIKIYRTLVNEN
jgi:glycosyltransferase involved in cell wall biosynthesis